VAASALSRPGIFVANLKLRVAEGIWKAGATRRREEAGSGAWQQGPLSTPSITWHRRNSLTRGPLRLDNSLLVDRLPSQGLRDASLTIP
jgi:hypothetical protein